MNTTLKTWAFIFFTAMAMNVMSQKNIVSLDEYTSLLKSLKEAREAKNNSDLAEIYFKLAVYEEEKNKNSELAFDYFIRAKQYFDRDQNLLKSNIINQIIGKRYAATGFTSEAIVIYKNLISYYENIKDYKTLAFVLTDLSKIYRESGDAEKALISLNKAINLNKKLRDTTLIIDINFEEIQNYLKLNEKDSALIISANAFKLASIMKDNPRLTKGLYYIGYINFLKKDFDKSIKYLESSIDLINIIPYDENRRDIYKALAEAYASKSLHKEAYFFSLKFNALNDSILNYNRVKTINDLSIRHQADQKEKDIKNLELENKSVLQKILLTRSAFYFVATGFFLLLLALYYLIRFYTQKIRVEKIINEQQHEIDLQKIRELEDNIKISSMQSMIVGQEKERERIATDLHDSLGGLLSAIKLQFDQVKTKLNGYINLDQYQKATNLLDTAVEEVRNISRNLQPGALKELGLVSAIKDLINRFDGESYPDIFFQYYNLEEKLDEMSALSIYRIIQELMTNTIKHAKAKEILIQITREGEEIIIEYEDDGDGIDLSTKSKRKGMGLENINSRVNYLKGSISINSRESEGVSYLIRIPYTKTQNVNF